MKYWIIGDEFIDGTEAKAEADAQGYLHELIRCKDCKYWDTDHLGYETMYCHRSDWNRLIRGAEDFCSRAERKEE